MKKIILFLICFFLTSCDFNKIYENREEDKQDAEKVTQRFYSLLEENNKPEVLKLFSDDFFKTTNKEKFNLILDKANDTYGKIQSYNLTDWRTLIIKGTNPKSDYILIYSVIRDNIHTQEKFSLRKEKGKIKIIGYRVNFDILTEKK